MKLLCALTAAAVSLSAQQYRAFWADAFHPGYKTPSQVDQMVEDAVTAKANAIFIEVRRRGDSYYLYSLEPPAEDPEYPPTFDALQYLIERAHPLGIEVHAWFPVTPLWPLPRPPQDPRHVWHKHGPGAEGEEMWMTVSSTGRISTSVDVGHPGVLQYLADVMLEPAKRYDIDGIHLDFIRYPEDANYGWNPTAVARFQRLENRTGSPEPADPAWSEFRRAQVAALVRQMYLRAYAIRPTIKITAALIAWGNGPASDTEFQLKDAYARVFQDWRGWMEEGIIDLGIPMNYDRDSVPAQAGYFDRWIEYEKDRQYRRGLLIGQGIYLNSIAESLAQLRRALAPSAAGNNALGVTFYSYASTNTLVAGQPVTPNPEFYRAAGEFFGDAARVPVLPWKAVPSRGHVYGWLHVDGGPAWLKDGASIWIESDTRAFVRQTVTDGAGFFGAVDLPPDRYRVRLLRAGQEMFRATPQNVAEGDAARFDIWLKAEDFAGVIPRVRTASRTAAAPGDVITISGSALTSQFAPATAVPLPIELNKTQVVANGVAAPMFYATPDRIELQLPYLEADSWEIVVRHAGLESQPLRLEYREAVPVILAARKRGDGYLEIVATGLGPVSPPIPAGLGGPAGEPFNLTVLPVLVKMAGQDLQPEYSGLMPFYPGRYLVTVKPPAGVTGGELRLQAGDAISPPIRVSE